MTAPPFQKQVSNENLQRIKNLLMGEDEESKTYGRKWLEQLVGEKDAIANLFVLMFYKDWDDDSDLIIDDKNYCSMKSSTYKISFGKDYRYKVRMIAMFNGKLLLSEENDYSRYQVGSGDPKWDFCQLVCGNLKKQGVKFYDGLFVKK